MEFSLYDNGLDSFKKAKRSIDEFERLHQEFAYHHLKDSIIFLNHAIEILFKYLLYKKHEVLLFKNTEHYFAAKEQLYNERKKYAPNLPGEGFGQKRNNLHSVFDVEKGKKLKTITLIEALERVKYIYETTISEDLEGAVRYLNDYRNMITHHSISIDSSEADILISNIKFTYQNSIVFFDKHLPGTLEIIDQEIFELTKEEYEEHQRDMEDYYQEVAMSKIT